MIRKIVIKNKKNSNIYNIDFTELKYSEDLFKNKNKVNPIKKIKIFWHFESFEEMKNNLLKEISELYSSKEINEENYHFLSDNIEEYYEEKKNPNFNRVYWKR